MSQGLEKSISIGADRARIFKALTLAEELMKWFPSVAKTDPQAGGKMRYECAMNAL
jgi:uncharacterized protein YndB with AHSA1/START domain